MTRKLIIIPIVLILFGCGTNYEVTRADGGRYNETQYQKDKFECETFARLSYRSAYPDAVWADLGRTDITISCLKSRGYSFKEIR